MKQTFHRSPRGGPPLFSVQPGVPVDSALEHASNLLHCVSHAFQQAANDASPQVSQAIWSGMYMIEAANAIVDACLDAERNPVIGVKNCTIGKCCS